MTISKYLTVSKAVSLFIIITVLQSCNSTKDNPINESYLGYPKSNSIALRVKPSDFLNKISFFTKRDTVNNKPDLNKQKDTPKNDNSNVMAVINSILGSAPNTTELFKNHYKDLIPDLSKNWVAGGDVLGNGGYAFIYLSYAGEQFLEKHIKEKGITIISNDHIKHAYLDEIQNTQSVVVFDHKHLLILSHQGDKENFENILKLAIYDKKDSFLTHYKSTFNGQTNDINISLTPSEGLLNQLKEPLLKDILSNNDFNTSLSFDEKNVLLSVQPSSGDFCLDTILNNHLFVNTGLTTAGASINMNSLELFLKKYDFMGGLNHELNKLKTNYSELKNTFNGNFNISYIGKVNSKQKTISYEYDDDFNQVEKVKYTYSSSHDLFGKLGLVSSTKSIKSIENKKWIVKTGSNLYEPIALSKSPIKLHGKELMIGKNRGGEKLKGKFYISVNEPMKLSTQLGIKELSQYNYLNSGSVLLNEENELSLRLNFNENIYDLIDIVKSFSEM